MKKELYYFICFISIFFTNIANAQNDPCGCDIDLPKDLRDEITSIYKVDLDSSLSLIYNKSFTYWEDGEWKNDQSMQSGGDAYYDMYSGFLNANDTKEQR